MSPMLFILVMEPLQMLIKATWGRVLLTPICNRRADLSISMFDDDAVILLNPVKQEVNTVKEILY